MGLLTALLCRPNTLGTTRSRHSRSRPRVRSRPMRSRALRATTPTIQSRSFRAKRAIIPSKHRWSNAHSRANLKPTRYTAATASEFTSPLLRVRAAAKGWQWADKNRDQAVDILVKDYPNLNRADERAAADG